MQRSAFIAGLVLAISGIWTGTGAAAQGDVYFDAHNHFPGILPYYAYANLPRFIENLSDPSRPVGFEDRRALLAYLAGTWYPSKGAALDDKPFSAPDGQRFALGSRAALVVYRDAAKDPKKVDGVLERVLTATPWSEFDSAYAFRGGPAHAYLLARFYGGSYDRLEADLCKATYLDLAATNIQISEQSLPFIGGWQFRHGRSDKLDTIECVLRLRGDATVLSALRSMHEPAPDIRFVLMTHTSQLATLPGGQSYSEFSKTGACAPVGLPHVLVTTPETIYHALMAQDDAGALVVPAPAVPAFYSAVAGIDTAGPETTCFSDEGMKYFERLAEAVYRAAKDRRAGGWHGKLLVHTHVGENSSTYFSPSLPAQPWTFADTFATLPAVRSNAEQAHENIAMLSKAVADLERSHPDLHDYVVFRFAHATWADDKQAQTLHDLGIETDINLESNVATGAYPLARMPLGAALLKRFWIDPLIGNPQTNLRLNDLLEVLVANGANVRQVGGILGNVSLRFMLQRHVRCILGTDGDGVEHSDIVKEYAYASSLIDYWNRTDPSFASLASGISERTLFANAQWHLHDMATDTAQPY